MENDRIRDPVLGEGEILFGRGEGAWATFEREFPPTKSRVLVLASVVNGSVPRAQQDLYREIEAWYPKGVQEVFEGVRREVEKDEVLKKWLPPDEIQDRLQLIKINIRIPFDRPVKCVLDYQFDPNAPGWYVVISEDYHVESCGLLD
jgi:hypothetical protein